MGIFSRLFKENKKFQEPSKNNEKSQSETQEDQWVALPAYIESSPEERDLIGLLASVLAAEDAPNSQFVVKKILKRNPEAQLVTLIAASLATETQGEQQVRIKKIARKQLVEE